VPAANDFSFSSAKTLALQIRRRRIGALEALDHFIARIERLDRSINAVVVRDFARARKRARALDRSRGPAGPLHGVPMTVKESFDVAGLATTWGLAAMRDNVVSSNALAVERLQAAGAVVFGKTNVPRLLLDWQSFNVNYGVTNNPWDCTRTPGGSSGGSSAALAAGLTGLDIGSDIGGSIRVPAHFCGLFGHKPTWGLCPPRGHSLLGTVVPTDISAIGPLARSAEDLTLALDAIAGPDAADTSLRYVLPPPRTASLKGLRVAVWAEEPATTTDHEISAKLSELARALQREGAKVGLRARPAFDPKEAYQLFLRLLAAAVGTRLGPEQLAAARARAAASAPDDDSADAVLDRNYDLSHGDWIALNERRAVLRRTWQAFFNDWDVVLCPAFGTAALPHELDVRSAGRRITIGGVELHYNDLLFWPGIAGGFYLPATTAPLGFTRTGLPLGVQIVGPLYGDRTTIAVARQLERRWLAFTAPANLG
jgi:amidase